MKENTLYGPITKSFTKDGWIAIKIIDGSIGLKPFDIFGISPNGRGMCCEVKVHDVKTVDEFPEKKFAKHQIAYMQAYSKRNAFAIAAVYQPSTSLLYLYKPNKEGKFIMFAVTVKKADQFDSIGYLIEQQYDLIG